MLPAGGAVTTRAAVEAAVAATAEADSASVPSGASWIPVIRRHLGSDLVQATAVDRIRDVARRLPPDALFALETRLASPHPQTDLSCRIDPSIRIDAWVRRLPPSHRRDFLETWKSTGQRGLQRPTELWLELDLDAESGFPDPVLCLRLDPSTTGPWIVEHLWPRFRGHHGSSVTTDLILHCLEHLPAGVTPLYFFDLSARPGQDVRLEFYAESLAPLLAHLEHCVCQQAANRLRAVAPLCDDGDRFHLSLDLSADGISERLGLEVSYRRLPHREPRWRGLFDRLVASGLCHRNEREAVFRWPGSDTARTTGFWPRGVSGGHCVRCLSHVKLVTRPDRDPRAKVYLLFQHLRKSDQG